MTNPILTAAVWLAFSACAIAQPPGFRADNASTLPPDGVSVLAPPSSCSTVLQLVTGTGWKQLAYQNVVPWSVTLDTDGDDLDCTDRELHGHAQWCHTPHEPWIDHARGLLRLPDPNKTWSVTYQTADKPGRWIREWTHDQPVTPSMCGGSPHWAATMAGRLGRNVHFEGELYRSVIELPNGVQASGRLKLDAQHLMASLRKDAFNPHGGWRTRLEYLLNHGMPCLTVVSGAKRVSLVNLHLDGQYQTVDWNAVRNSGEWDVNLVSQKLREGPVGAGFSAIAQSGRVVDGLEVYLDRVYAGGFPSSCIAASPVVAMRGQWVTCGSSVSGRPFYVEGPVSITGLDLGDFTRTSHHRGGANSRITGLRYRSSGVQNPWPENEVPGAIASTSNARGDGWAEWSGIDIDCRNSGVPVGLQLGASGRFSGRVRGGDVNVHPNMRGAVHATWDLDVIDGRVRYLSVGGNATGNFAMLDARLFVQRVDNRPTINWDDYNDWTRKIDTPIQLRVARNATHPPGHTQTVRLQLVSPWPCQAAFHIPDLASATDVVPTTIHIYDSRFDEQFTTLVAATNGVTEAVPAGLGAKPVRVVFERCQFNLQKPRPGRGNAQPAQFEFVELRDCRDATGRLIDVAKVIDGTWWE